nr:acyl-CoA dehydrogenase family protein [Rhizobiaceae bacterium]
GELIEEVAARAMKLALATTERHSRYDLAQVETRAVRDGEGWRLSGAKGVVARGDVADRFVVSARTAGGSGDEAGIGLFLVDPSAAGVTRRGYRMQDGRGACELSLENVAVGPQALLGDPEAGHVALARVADEAIAALAAEAVGVMETMQALTLAYIKERKQFGRAIGDFQVLQHRAAEMFVALEQARSMAIYAASMADEADATELRRAMAMTKVMIGQSGRLIGESAIQMHGGVGMTAEYAIGHYFKRMTMIDIAFGDAGYHLQNLAEER